MENINDSISMLQMFQHPTFFVKNGIITGVNQYAENMDILQGMQISEFIPEYSDAYETFTDGCLSMTLCINGANCIAVVIRMEDCDIFHLREASADSYLNSVDLIFQQMRQPLGEAITSMEECAEKTRQKSIQYSIHNMYKLLRFVNNFSAASQCAVGRKNGMVVCNMTSILSELFQHIEKLIAETNVDFHYALPSEDIFAPIDEEPLTTAILNMISNAIKGADRSGKVHVEVTYADNKLNICVTNDIFDKDIKTEGIFFRHMRGSQVEDGRFGSGFGVMLIQLVAAAHNGSLLLTRLGKKQLRFTLTISTKVMTGDILRSQLTGLTVTQGIDNRLVGLSDALSSTTFPKK